MLFLDNPRMKTEQLLRKFKSVYYIRRVEEEIAARYNEQEMRCPVHLSIGQEAVAVGIASCMSIADHFVSAHRSHAHYLAKGGSLPRLLGELYGKASGCAGGKGGSMHLIDPEVNFTAAVPIVGSSISIGVGVAFGLSLSAESSSKVAVFFGDGATEEGVFAESLDFAAIHNLPVIFVCENNLYSVYTPLTRRQAVTRNIQRIAEAHGVKSLSGDGNSVSEVTSLGEKAVQHINSGNGPVLLHFETYRWLEHCGPNWDDDLGYRPKGELSRWMSRCPLDALTREIMGHVGDISLLEEIKDEVDAFIRSAFDDAQRAPFPTIDKLFTNIYPSPSISGLA